MTFRNFVFLKFIFAKFFESFFPLFPMPFSYYPSLEALKLRTMSIREDPISTLKERKKERERKKLKKDWIIVKINLFTSIKHLLSLKVKRRMWLKCIQRTLALLAKQFPLKIFFEKKEFKISQRRNLIFWTRSNLIVEKKSLTKVCEECTSTRNWPRLKFSGEDNLFFFLFISTNLKKWQKITFSFLSQSYLKYVS